jgi:hypothetical protein
VRQQLVENSRMRVKPGGDAVGLAMVDGGENAFA